MFVSKTSTFAKLLFYLSSSGLAMYVTLAVYTLHTAHVSKLQPKNVPRSIIYNNPKESTTVASLDMKYILMYSPNSKYNHYKDIIEGKVHFSIQKCQHRNCILTRRSMLINRDVRNFDAIVIHVNEFYDMKLPEKRYFKQKYILHGIEAPDRKFACSEKLDNFFNWTWSYRLNSDIVSPFFEVRNLKGEIVAPRLNVQWTDEIATTYLKKDHDLLFHKKKTRSVAALIKNCRIEHGKVYAKKLRSALKYYSLTLDMHGCNFEKCPNDTEASCRNRLLKSEYHFVLVQEKTFAEDYLTKDVYTAYSSNAIPLIRSGADLKRFLPTGSYINVRGYSVNTVAALIHYIINNPEVYFSYFRWKKFYTFHEPPRFYGICELCAMLNNKTLVEQHTSHSQLRKWWYTGDDEFCANVTEAPVGTKVTEKINHVRS